MCDIIILATIITLILVTRPAAVDKIAGWIIDRWWPEEEDQPDE